MNVTAIRQALQALYESLIEVNIEWREEPRSFAGPGAYSAGAPGGIQGTLKILSVDSVGEDVDVVVEASDSGIGSVEFKRTGTRLITVSFQLWSWSQSSEHSVVRYIEILRSMLQTEDTQYALDLACMSLVDFDPTVDLDPVEDGRVTNMADLTTRFYASIDTPDRVGYLIDAVTVEGVFEGGQDDIQLSFDWDNRIYTYATQDGFDWATQGGLIWRLQ